MAFIKTKLSTIRPNDLYDTLRLAYGFNNEEDQKQPGILAKPAEPVSDSDVVAAGFFDYMLTKSRERAAKLRAEAMEQYARDSAEEAAKIRSILGITRSKAPTEQLSDTARDAMFSSSDMRGTELTMKDNAREAQEVFQPTITPVSRGEQPEMTDSPAPVDAPSVDARSNEMLDKPKGIMSKDIEDVLKTVLDSDANDSTDSADGGAAPSDGKDFEIPEYKVYESPDDMSELEILARTIEAEAALEPYKGKIAVGATIANRAASSSYGKEIRGVILRRGQFSPWNSWTGYAKGEQGKDMMKLRASEDSYKAANDILTGNYEDPTDGATHYVNEKVSKPAWLGAMKGRKRGTLTIGNHLFGNADSNKKYDGKSYIFDRKSETTNQPVEAAPVTVKAIQRIIGTTADGDFGPASRKKAIEYLSEKDIKITKDTENEALMRLVVGS